jgi:hypothetical protein
MNTNNTSECKRKGNKLQKINQWKALAKLKILAYKYYFLP